MKKVFSCCLFLCCAVLLTPRPSKAQTGQWAWMKGSNTINQYGLYQSVPTTPGSRKGGASWTDNSGNLWVFGGAGFTDGTSTGLLNDLWKFDKATGNWACAKGNNQLNQSGTYGTQGVAAPGNTPGARCNSASWTDKAGNLWLFGGTGDAGINPIFYYYNDLWKYDVGTGNWTWMKGSSQMDQQGIYGSLGVAATGNTPGSRYGSNYWADNSGNLWLFGGMGRGTPAFSGCLNDLWKYDVGTGNWVCISGNDVQNQPGNYGAQGVAAATNIPGARFGSISWQDNTGNLWLFGGGIILPNAISPRVTYGDLWKYNIAAGTWTWMKGSINPNETATGGTQGVAADTNTPGARFLSSAWKDASGNLWLFGGHQNFEMYILYNAYDLNDVWKYDVSTGNWTWVKGSTTINQSGTYGTQGVAATGNTPGSRNMAFSQTDNAGNLWLFGGMARGSGPDYGYENDLWKYETSTASWTWIQGGPAVNLGARYMPLIVTDASKGPGARADAYSWMDNGGNLWLFGGDGYPEGGPTRRLNDLWKYNTQTGNWYWVRGVSNLYQPGTYGTQGVAADTNYPGNRSAGASWKDAQGNFWLFGGIGNGSSATSGYLNDLWKLDVTTGRWAWMKGPAVINDPGTYGSPGTPAAANNPPGRYGATYWTDKSGNLWLFGGQTRNNTYTGPPPTPPALLNDLWKYDISTGNWTWMKGSNSPTYQGSYGTQGVAAATNTPGGRIRGIGCTDTSGNLWLMGGWSGANVNDLWKYDVSTGNWTWVKGSTTINQPAVYGTAGIAAPANTPGGGQYTAAWTDRNNCLWLFGGNGYTAGSSGYLNSTWKYDIATGNWAWMKGSTGINQSGNYGTLGIAAASNIPGSRNQSTAWADGNGSLWLFGGIGYDIGTTRGSLSDLWKFNDGSTPLPLTLTGFSATKEAGTAQLRWQTSYEQNLTAFAIERSSNSRFSSFTGTGTVTASGNTSLSHNYHFTDASPLKGPNYYRLKIIEKDGKASYSEIRLLNFGGSFSIALFPNPAKSKAVLSGVEAGMSIRTIGATGQTVIIQKATGNTVEIAVNLLPAGLYRVQVYGSDGILAGSTALVRE